MTRTPRHRRRPEARPEEILTAALAIFAEQGFAAARVEDIARRAGLSKGAVYLYFPSKEAMLNALVEQSAGALARTVEQHVAQIAAADPEAALRGLLRILFAAVSSPEVSAAPRLVLTEAHRFPELANFYREHVLDVMRRAMGALLAAAVETGVFRDVDTDAFMRIIAGPGLAQMALTTIFDLKPDRLTDPGDLADAIADILLYGLKPRLESANT
ncbi:TetR/AcrR family transcriptional regulator [Maricaulis salignorans]|uniref:DNA-binding transcriptional regulator, AcrR family n=1 Tax=Maricaulis salignorans TaxID=144026 RepID=A0A1G9WPY4_9PROT|nr:TetR/AcrR family transcriptional regulator [Maricaulis salignorans]SDM86311.1 DNA-binding transcriptional regulator, AcrR family [Maricaulis salignorans]